jgi:MATE family multidrug resistance protein
MVLGLVAGVSLGLVMILVRNVWGYAYSNEKEVVEYISRMMPILGMAFVFDDMQCVLSGNYGLCFTYCTYVLDS